MTRGFRTHDFSGHVDVGALILPPPVEYRDAFEPVRPSIKATSFPCNDGLVKALLSKRMATDDDLEGVGPSKNAFVDMVSTGFTPHPQKYPGNL
jgi:hypothetical protein